MALPYADAHRGEAHRPHWAQPPLAHFLAGVWQGKAEGIPISVILQCSSEFGDFAPGNRRQGIARKAYQPLCGLAP